MTTKTNTNKVIKNLISRVINQKCTAIREIFTIEIRETFTIEIVKFQSAKFIPNSLIST